MMKVSVITPLYHGKKYINRLFTMIESAAENAKQVAKVEWIISNDDPSEEIDNQLVSDKMDIVIINTNINRGIQGARVKGLEKCTGNYILFLDQDDTIHPEWISSQCRAIGDADAVVCDAIYDGKPLYKEGTIKDSLDLCITRKFNVEQHIGFTLGQTLIKKQSIPRIWLRRCMVTNCCDDHYLLICMYASDCVFVKNDRVLYEHVKTGSNQSEDSYVWVKSTHELIHIVEDEKILLGDELHSFIRSRELHIEEVISYYEDRQREVNLLRNILLCQNGEVSIKKVNIRGKKIAIYGYRIGVFFKKLLEDAGFINLCYIDRNSKNIASDIPIYKMEDTPETVDCIIDTLVNDKYKRDIREYYEKQLPNALVIEARDIFDI
ncbi:glycosyltransferase family 2 protein [Butyrivibrio sp. X503]|uniref:glycosyltransferase family 2 protein n=1 Tax=Butyrivibrio sp. X503 TaxID=2364878 RepID=UPI000EA9711A|nr:glycosyltransferase family 2 protein [Butyrivibrio sp. X503]RKM54436.1 glycosyltransferase family 2 protein [Butyrivibrio sp. X503]